MGDTWNEAAFTPSLKAVKLTILGSAADVAEFIARTYQNPNDLTALTIEEKAKAVGYHFNAALIMGIRR